MKRTWLLCVFSALAGGACAIVWERGPSVEKKALAQEAIPQPPAGMVPNGRFQNGPLQAGPAQGIPVQATPAQGGFAPGLAGPAQAWPTPWPAAVAQAGFAPPEFTAEERVNIWVYEQANRAVVNITTEGYQGERVFMIQVPSKGEGSGVIIDRLGHIVTNYHVVEGARQIQVTLFDGITYDARVVGQDPSSDVAVIKIEAPATSLFPVALGNSTDLHVGQRVFAIGNPFGLERTLSTGIISSLNRALPSRTGRSMKSIIQIDASINPGNSGGPLLNSHAQMIGMNVAIVSKSGESAGVGFAIPASTIARIVPQLLRDGKIRRAEAGIITGLKTDHGILITKLAPNGPAEKAGLRGPKIVRQQRRQGPFVYEVQSIDRSAADTIVAVDGKPIKTGDDFLDAIESKHPGDRVNITVIRGGQQVDVPLVLDAEE